MLKVTTKSGAAYLIDREEGRACRINNDLAPGMRFDGEWFSFNALLNLQDPDTSAPELGKAMYFWIRGHSDWDWRSTTPVVSIEEFEYLEEDQ